MGIYVYCPEYTVQMDTGSSDLWIFSNDALKINNRTDIVVTETYGIGQAEGPVVFANFQIGDYKVPNQGTEVSLDSV